MKKFVKNSTTIFHFCGVSLKNVSRTCVYIRAITRQRSTRTCNKYNTLISIRVLYLLLRILIHSSYTLTVYSSRA